MIKASEHRELLDRMLARYRLARDWLVIVPDVQAWCLANKVEERNPWRAAKCLYWPTHCRIAMRDEQTDAMISSAKGAMLYRGFDDELAGLDSDRGYLAHLMLHEIACYMLQTSEQKARDKWAFAEMRKHFA